MYKRPLASGCVYAINRLIAACVVALVTHLSFATEVLPQPEPPFKGNIAKTLENSVPDWPEAVKAPKGAPNIVVILLDDVGFAATSTFGGLVQTPTLNRLAAQGLRYNNFNTTSQCAGTRAALLTGRNHHDVGFGQISQTSAGFPGYNALWPKSTASIAEVLNQNGYHTAAFGKWHNTPHWEVKPFGPFDRWPTGLGFDYYYGFMAGQSSQWEPSLYRNTLPVEPSKTAEEGFHLTTAIADEAIAWLHTQESHAPETPYFLYFATGATHAPHHVAPEWIDPYQGKFDQGWDKLREEIFTRQKNLGVIAANAQLTARPTDIPAWDSLSAETKKLVSRQMEVFAGFMAHTDHEVGRLIDAIQLGPNGENTLIFYIVGDNGSGSASFSDDGVEVRLKKMSNKERLSYLHQLGGATIYNDYSLGWAWANSTPFQYWKTVASHFGGTRDPLIVSWPKRLRTRGELRTQFTHVTDITPTILDVAGIPVPSEVNGVKQKSIDGTSIAYSFGNKDAATRHNVQYFEAFGNRAMYEDGWIAVARHRAGKNHDEEPWELYHVEKDFSGARDLAGKYPEKLKALQVLFDQEARKNNVYPFSDLKAKPGRVLEADNRKFIYYPDSPRLPTSALPDFSKAHRITADIVSPGDSVQGTILSYGSRMNGFTLYIKDGYFIYENVSPGDERDIITAAMTLPEGSVELIYEFNPTQPPQPFSMGTVVEGVGKIYVNDQLAGEAKVMNTQPGMGMSGSVGIGRAYGSPVSEAYTPPFPFTGTIEKVTVEIP